MTKEISMANALGARTTRPCDSCMRRRARVYCAADDAFLCATCDSSVHSANPLARRHHRVPISPPPSSDHSNHNDTNFSFFTSPSWNKRKPRTPRQKPNNNNIPKSEPVHDHVPDLYESTTQNSEEDFSEENEQLLFQVPVFDPELSDFYNNSSSPVVIPPNELEEETKQRLVRNLNNVKSPAIDGVAGFQISETDLEEFAADMESLLGGVPDDFNGLGSLMAIDDLKVDTAEEEEEMVRDYGNNNNDDENVMEKKRSEKEKERDKLLLKLDYEGVITAWGCNGGSPWTNGERPQFQPNYSWPDFKVPSNGSNDVVGIMYKAVLSTEGREARVSRYREKRRTRLFAKKIRYEVRKLNAEKRPRMKGRFVKRATPVPTIMKSQVPIQRTVIAGKFSNYS